MHWSLGVVELVAVSVVCANLYWVLGYLVVRYGFLRKIWPLVLEQDRRVKDAGYSDIVRFLYSTTLQVGVVSAISAFILPLWYSSATKIILWVRGRALLKLWYEDADFFFADAVEVDPGSWYLFRP